MDINTIREFSDDTHEVGRFLHEITKYPYSFVVATKNIWGFKSQPENEELVDENLVDEPDGELVNPVPEAGTFYQLIPDTVDDGFFNWYSQERSGYQFHNTREMAVVYFLKYWIIWNSKGKPGPVHAD